VKPTQPRQSTTETPPTWYFYIRQSALNLSVGSASIIAAVLAHAFLHTDVRLSLLAGALVGAALLAPQVVFAGLCVLYGVVSALAGVIYVGLKREDPAAYLMTTLSKITCIIIGLRTLTPPPVWDDRSARSDVEKRHEATSVSPLPSALNAALTEDALPSERRDLVTQSPAPSPVSRQGRHVKPATASAATTGGRDLPIGGDADRTAQPRFDGHDVARGNAAAREGQGYWHLLEPRMARSGYASAPPASSMTLTAGQPAQVKSGR
jgi:hypothetical protein